MLTEQQIHETAKHCLRIVITVVSLALFSVGAAVYWWGC